MHRFLKFILFWKLVRLVDFTIEIYYDTGPYERQSNILHLYSLRVRKTFSLIWNEICDKGF